MKISLLLYLLLSLFKGISFKEYMDFYRVMLFINDIDTALTFYNIAGASIDKGFFIYLVINGCISYTNLYFCLYL